MSTFIRTCGVALTVLSIVSSTCASPLYNYTEDGEASQLVARGAPGFQLKVLAVGDSITAGLGHSNGDSYRADLKFFLTAGGYNVDYTGREDFGTPPDNQHEGYAARKIDQIREQLKSPTERKPELPNPMSQQPNLVLIHAGTNDMYDANDAATPGSVQRLERLVNYITCRNPYAVVVVAQIVINKWQNNDAYVQRTRNFNNKVNEMLFRKRVNGEKVWMADMGQIPNDSANFMDGVHPNNNGYNRMAQIWYNVINSISTSEWRASNPNDWVGKDVWCNNLGYT